MFSVKPGGKGKKGKVDPFYVMKASSGADFWFHSFLTSALLGCEWSTLRPSRFSLRERTPVPTGGGWVGPLARLDLL